MPSPRELRGHILQGETPVWGPLLELAPDVVDDFIWMFEVAGDDGSAIHAYKHWSTRGYLHLDCHGRAFVYVGNNHYREVDPYRVLRLVLDPPESID